MKYLTDLFIFFKHKWLLWIYTTYIVMDNYVKKCPEQTLLILTYFTIFNRKRNKYHK